MLTPGRTTTPAGRARKALRLAALTLPLAGSLVVLPAQAASAAGSTNYFSDTFGESSTTSAVSGINGQNYDDSSSTGFPCLTAGTSTTQTPIAGCGLGSAADPSGSGALRLTDTGSDEVSDLLGTTPLPTAAGLDVTFTEAQYAPVGGGSDPGDGISFFLNSGTQNPVQPGGDRGSLGYSPDRRHGAPGLLDGYLGVGFDESGLYGTANDGGEDCTATTTTPSPGQVVVRGSGVGFDGYCTLASSTADTPDPLGPATFQGTTRTGSEKAVQILVDPVAMTVTVGVGTPGTGVYTTVASGPLPSSYYDINGNGTAGVPPTVYFGLGADTDNVTGASTSGDIHEITDLSVSSMGLTTPTPSLPEAPVTALLPVLGVAVGIGALRHRRRAAPAG